MEKEVEEVEEEDENERVPYSSRPAKAHTPQAIADLIVTQTAPRDVAAVVRMARFVREGGVFSPELMFEHVLQRAASADSGDGHDEGDGDGGVVNEGADGADEDESTKMKTKATKLQKNRKQKKGAGKAGKPKKPVRPQHERRTQAQLRASCAPVILAHLPDDRLYVWDGHHRVAAVYLGGRDHLLPEEYLTVRFNFKFVKTVSFATWFLTPFDPRTEIRVPEFGSFKNEVAVLLKKKKRPEAEVVDYITSNRHLYVLPRTFSSVAEMVACLNLEREPPQQ